MPLHVEVITPEKKALSKEVESIVAPAIDGQVGILPGHAPLLTALGDGELRLTNKQSTHHLAISGGFLEVREGNRVAIFAETAEMAEEIDIERAKMAAEKAKGKLKDPRTLSPEEMARIQADLSRAVLRMKIGRSTSSSHKPGPGIR